MSYNKIDENDNKISSSKEIFKVHKAELDSHAIQRLQRHFPYTNESVIIDALKICDRDEQKAGDYLYDNGNTTTHPHYSKRRHEVLTKQAKAKEKPKQSIDDQQPVERAKLKTKLLKEFPSIPASNVEFYLEASMFNESRARTLLKLKVQNKSKDPSRQVSTSKDSSIPSTSKGSAVKGTKTVVSKAVQSSRSNNSAIYKVQQIKSHKITRYDGYRSKLRTKPNGPNPDIVKGPDFTFLNQYYAPVKGPDPENVKGPNPHLVSGPSWKQQISKV